MTLINRVALGNDLGWGFFFPPHNLQITPEPILAQEIDEIPHAPSGSLSLYISYAKRIGWRFEINGDYNLATVAAGLNFLDELNAILFDDASGDAKTLKFCWKADTDLLLSRIYHSVVCVNGPSTTRQAPGAGRRGHYSLTLQANNGVIYKTDPIPGVSPYESAYPTGTIGGTPTVPSAIYQIPFYFPGAPEACVAGNAHIMQASAVVRGASTPITITDFELTKIDDHDGLAVDSVFKISDQDYDGAGTVMTLTIRHWENTAIVSGTNLTIANGGRVYVWCNTPGSHRGLHLVAHARG